MTPPNHNYSKRVAWSGIRVLAFLLLGAGLGQADEPTALFRASFEERLSGMDRDGKAVPCLPATDTSPGTVGAVSPGRYQFGPGKRGKGLRCYDGFWAQYPAAGHIRLASGTVELWVRPEDWDASHETRHHVFFEMNGSHCWMALYRYFQPGRGLFFLINDNLERNWQIAEQPISWAPGQWHHVAISWSRDIGTIRLYIDGRLANELDFPIIPFPTELPERFSIGDGAWGSGLNHCTTIDEVIIWDRLLSSDRIALHAKGDFASAPPLSADSVVLRTEAEGDGEKWRYRFHLLESGTAPDALRLELAVASRSGGKPVWRQTVSGGLCPGPTGGYIDLTGLPPGEYMLTWGLFEQTRKIAEGSRSLWKFDPVWKRKPKTVEQVLPPWTPVKLRSEDHSLRLECWNRAYTYSGGILPARISSGTRELLAGPIELEAAFNDGKKVRWQVGPVEHMERKDAHAAFQRQADGPELNLKTHVRLEFDGALFTDFSLAGKRAGELNTLVLNIPLHAENARYIHRTDALKGGVNRTVDQADGVRDKGRFNPYIWIGGNDCGLAFFTDTNRAWPNSLRPDAFEVVRKGSRVTLRLNLMKTGQMLPRPWIFRFGLMATPVKPLPPDWRKGRIAAAEKATISVLWPNPTDWKYFGHPDFKDHKKMKQACDQLWKQGMRPIQYLTLHQLSSATPEWQVYGKRWALIGGWNDTFCEMNLKTPFMAVCAPAGWGDYWVWRIKKAIDEFDYGGLYFDNCFIKPCGNTLHGHGPWRDGVYDFQIESLRSAYRRLYAAIKKKHADGVIVHHMSGNLIVFLQAYADYSLDGEHLKENVAKADGHYTRVLSLDELRAEYMGRQWGIAPLLLPEIPGIVADDPVKGPARTREMMALLMLHDIGLWAAYCHFASVVSIQKVMDNFGWLGDTKFYPYFDPRCPASVKGDGLYVSVYSRPEDRAAIAVLANLRPRNVKTRVKVDADALALPATAVARDAESGMMLGKAGRFDVVVPGLNLRLIYLAAPEAPSVWPAKLAETSSIDRSERVRNGGFESLVTFNPKAGGWPRTVVKKGWRIGKMIPAAWTPHTASPPGVLRVMPAGEAHTGQAALYLGDSCFVAGTGFPVHAGQVYRISFWAKGGGEASLLGIRYDIKDGKTVFRRTTALLTDALTSDWKYYVGTFRPERDVNHVVCALQSRRRGDHACFDDVSIRQVSDLEGRIIDTFGALRTQGLYIEPSANVPPGASARAEAALADARRKLAAALKNNPDATARSMALQVDNERRRLAAAGPPKDAATRCARINRLNGLAMLIRKMLSNVQCVDVRGESGD